MKINQTGGPELARVLNIPQWPGGENRAWKEVLADAVLRSLRGRVASSQQNWRLEQPGPSLDPTSRHLSPDADAISEATGAYSGFTGAVPSIRVNSAPSFATRHTAPRELMEPLTH
jgi:hypothetical protein